MGIFLLILLLILLFWPWISKFISRMVSKYMARRYEDMMRRMMGMPSRKEEERRRKEATSRSRKRGEDEKRTRDSKRRGDNPDPAEAMKAVAEDVEYTEIREFESTTIAESTPEGTTIYHEEQVTDAEFVEIKEPNEKK